MNSIRKLSIVILLCAIVQFACIIAQPADLGTFGTHNDLQNGVASYSLPPDNRLPNDIFVLAFINYTYVKSDGKEIHFAEEKAKYGEGRVKNVVGKVVHITNGDDVNDHTACTDRINGTNGKDLPSPGTPWIALIRRGNCPFDDKIMHVYQHQATGAIVYNDRNETILNKMKIIDQTRKYEHYYHRSVFTKLKIAKQFFFVLFRNTPISRNLVDKKPKSYAFIYGCHSIHFKL